MVFDVGVNVSKKDIFGKRAIESAKETGSGDIVEMLLRAPSLKKLNGEILLNNINRNCLINCKMNGVTE